MHEKLRTHEQGFKMVDVTFEANAFAAEEHRALQDYVKQILNGKVKEDLTIGMFALTEDAHIKEPWRKARYVAENAACLLAADQLVGWGQGYRSDDGYDYLTAAIDNARFLTDIDLDEADFMKWWGMPSINEGEPMTGSMGQYLDFGGCDGEIRYFMFPQRIAREEA